MDFRVNEDQEALMESIRSFCEGRVSIERLRELEGKGFDKELWQEIAEMGVFSLRRPESEGGVGLGMVEAVLVFEELGKAIVPGPLVWSHLAAGLVDGADTGETVVGGLDLIEADGAPYVIEHLEDLDVLLVLRDEGVDKIDARAVSGKQVKTPFDPLTPVFEASELPTGERIGNADLSAGLRLQGAAIASGFLLGIAEATLDLANAYAKQREQFGRVIGSFQAMKHILADCYVRQEAARAAAYAAAATYDDPSVGDVARAASAAKIVAGEAAMKNARACIQVHGGMGFTWEVPAHYYWKRTWVYETVFGTVADHADALAEVTSQAAARSVR